MHDATFFAPALPLRWGLFVPEPPKGTTAKIKRTSRLKDTFSKQATEKPGTCGNGSEL
jgi:hypothetical protein